MEYDKLIEEKILNYNYVCGVDEAGAGPWAGDLVVAACILDPENPIIGLNDSKKLSEKQRELLYPQIIEKALEYCIIHITPKEIDASNILACRMDGMSKAIKGLIKADYALVDGNRLPKDLTIDADFVIKGDSKFECIGAASILAKVSRDRMIVKQAAMYPEYSFEKHKGYGTKIHMEALEKHGPCEIHRFSYKPIKKLSD